MQVEKMFYLKYSMDIGG